MEPAISHNIVIIMEDVEEEQNLSIAFPASEFP